MRRTKRAWSGEEASGREQGGGGSSGSKCLRAERATTDASGSGHHECANSQCEWCDALWVELGFEATAAEANLAVTAEMRGLKRKVGATDTDDDMIDLLELAEADQQVVWPPGWSLRRARDARRGRLRES